MCTPHRLCRVKENNALFMKQKLEIKMSKDEKVMAYRRVQFSAQQQVFIVIKREHFRVRKRNKKAQAVLPQTGKQCQDNKRKN